MADHELPDCDTPAAVLAFAQEQRAAVQRAEFGVLEAALGVGGDAPGGVDLDADAGRRVDLRRGGGAAGR